MGCSLKDAMTLHRLYREYVGSGVPNAKRLLGIVQRETRAVKKGTVHAPPKLLRKLNATSRAVAKLAARCR